MKQIQHNPKLTKRAQELRKNATRHERHLWYDFLADYPVRFRRQVTIDSYIVDFYCHKAKIVVELDGGQHYESPGISYDMERTAKLELYGLKVLRFANSEIDANFRGVCEYIDAEVQKRIEK